MAGQREISDTWTHSRRSIACAFAVPPSLNLAPSHRPASVHLHAVRMALLARTVCPAWTGACFVAVGSFACADQVTLVTATETALQLFEVVKEGDEEWLRCICDQPVFGTIRAVQALVREGSKVGTDQRSRTSSWERGITDLAAGASSRRSTDCRPSPSTRAGLAGHPHRAWAPHPAGV